MKITRKLAALCAVFLLSLSLFCTVAYAAPEDEPPAETPSGETVTPVIPDGKGKVVDVFTGEDGRKFYTIQTPAGNTFYLIIDFTMTGENVYFLDAVQEKDLLALAEKAKTANGGSAATDTDPNNNTNSEPSGNQTEPKKEQDNTSNLIMFGVVFVVVIGGGAVYLIKGRKGKQNNDRKDEYEDEPDDYIPDDYDNEPEDNSPPWEDNEDA
ncbi:MAG: DUF4366 domain-containing protein [Oscillospiraceae bacterium]|jgi:hypothetical protein|nr:DUF4366 domain-containing protein [Oscillospiraceae bacterium]